MGVPPRSPVPPPHPPLVPRSPVPTLPPSGRKLSLSGILERPSLSGIAERSYADEHERLEEGEVMDDDSGSVSERTSSAGAMMGRMQEVPDEWKMGLLGECGDV